MPFLLMECPLLLVSTRYVTARDGARSQMASIDEDTSYEEKRKKGHQKRGCAQGNECPPCQVSCHVHGCYVTQHRDTIRSTDLEHAFFVETGPLDQLPRAAKTADTGAVLPRSCLRVPVIFCARRAVVVHLDPRGAEVGIVRELRYEGFPIQK